MEAEQEVDGEYVSPGRLMYIVRIGYMNYSFFSIQDAQLFASASMMAQATEQKWDAEKGQVYYRMPKNEDLVITHQWVYSSKEKMEEMAKKDEEKKKKLQDVANSNVSE